MQERTKLMNRGYSVVLLLSIGLTFFTGQPPIVMASVSATPSTPVPTTQACRVQTPHYNPAPHVYATDSAHTGDLTYGGGHVIDGIANVYLIYWLHRPTSHKYISLSEQFVKDFGQRSPLYMDLSQYHDSSGRCPTGARLAGTFVDTRSLPSELTDRNMTPDQANPLVDAAIRKEIADVAAKKGWNTQDYHNLYGIFYNATAGGVCDEAYHGVLQSGSPVMFLHSCPYSPSSPHKATSTNPSPNHDKDADDLVGSFSHEFSEAVTDPLLNGWSASNGEIADKCQPIPQPVDRQTHGDVTWHGHTYLIALEYSNRRHGCVLEGP